MHFFAIPALHPEDAQPQLNAFCAAHRVVAVERQFVTAGLESFWALCVVVAAGPGPLPDTLKAPERRSGSRGATLARIDYKTVLNAADFAVYAALRGWRKATAEQEGVPVYAVFTNEQLAEIAQRRVATLAELGEIDGIGAARLQRYGAAVIALLQTVPPPAAED